ncbi:hypothetical protein H8356DRAFT_1650197 [Neocallimastix lanati (nom. inval.)]|nr:hypothetical protein H8356DRAFT_1650197 [Neocallimastix sp. JGI-2020a]
MKLLGLVNAQEDNIKKIFTKRLNIYIFAIICTFFWASVYPTICLGYDEFFANKNYLKNIILILV